MNEDALYQRIATILDDARGESPRTVNTAMVHAYWLVGREIVLVEQDGASRATYGEDLLRGLAKRLAEQFGKGFTSSSLRRMRQFFLYFPNGSTVPWLAAENVPQRGTLSVALFPPILSWTHYRVLVRSRRAEARSFYGSKPQNWSVRELRTPDRHLPLRTPDPTGPRTGPHPPPAPARVATPRDVIRTLRPQFLELPEHRHSTSATSNKPSSIASKPSSSSWAGFCQSCRQKRLTLDGDHFYVDLVFYNRLLRAFVLVDLKLGSSATRISARCRCRQR
jgi:hypothetical protein